MRLTLLTLLMGTGLALFAQQPKIMTLQECVDLAVQNNLNVQRSKLNLETAEVNKMQADFQRFPTLNANGSYGTAFGRSIDPFSNQITTQQLNQSSASLNSSMVLYNGGQISNSIKQNDKDAEAALYDLDKAKNDVQINVVTFYLNVIFNQELLENARFQLASSQDQLERTKKLVEAGSLPRTNELELISQVSTNELNLINAENSLNLAKLNLKQVMLLPANENIEVVRPDFEVEQLLVTSSTEEVFSISESTMPEIRSVDARVESSEYGYQASVGGRYPTLTLNGSLSTSYSSAANRPRQFFDGTQIVPVEIGYLGSNPSELVYTDAEVPILVSTDDNFSFFEQYRDNQRKFISLNLSIPIFNGHQTTANIQRSKISMQQASINAMEQRNLLRQTIETAFNDAQAASKSYAAAEKQVSSLEETFRSVENQFNNGAANATDLQVAQNNLYRAKSDLTRAKFDFIFKKKLLDFYQGKSIF